MTDGQFYAIIFVLFIVVLGFERLGKWHKQKRIDAAYGFPHDKVHATAHWAEDKDLRKAKLFDRGGIHFGFSPDGKRPLRYQKNGHLLLVAAARTGKLLTVICGLILSLNPRTSALLIDPKAEITCVCGRARRRAGKVYAWNPYAICLDHMKYVVQAGCNPMLDIDPDSVNCDSDCKKLTSTYWTESAKHDDVHWSPSAHGIVSRITYTLVKYGKPHEKNLPTVRSILTGANGPSFYEFCREAMKIPDPYIKQELARYAAAGAEESKELAGIISTAVTQTAFLSNKAIADSLMRADFSFRDLKRRPGTTISVCLPVHRLEDGKCFALLSGWGLHCMQEEALRGSRTRCLAVIDEMAEIGYSKAWLDAFGLGAGTAQLMILAVYQDVNQIKSQFGEAWRTIVQNCGVTMWFGARDESTRQTVSDLAGIAEVISRSRGVTIDKLTGEPVVNDSQTQTTRPLIRPDEVGALNEQEMVVFCEGVPPIKAQRKSYLKEFSGYSPNPYYESGFWSRLFN